MQNEGTEEFQLELDEEGLIKTISCVIDSSGVQFPKLDLHLNKDGISSIATGNKVQNIQNGISSSDIEIGEVIGQGASSFVSKGVYKPSNYPIGIKLLKGLEFLHRVRHQVHRDIKPENILINRRGEVKLTDFGISKQLEKTQELCKTFVGTTLYMSPERLVGTQYGLRSDIWSVGLVVIELATGQYPYESKNKSIVQFVSSILSSKQPTLPDNGLYSPQLIDFINKCVAKEQKDRQDVSDLLKHEWICKNCSGNDNELSELLQNYLNNLEINYYTFKSKQQQEQLLQQGQAQNEY